MNREPILHWNIGGSRGWTTACGIKSSSFTDKEDEREDVDCKRCRKTLDRQDIFRAMIEGVHE